MEGQATVIMDELLKVNFMPLEFLLLHYIVGWDFGSLKLKSIAQSWYPMLSKSQKITLKWFKILTKEMFFKQMPQSNKMTRKKKTPPL